MKRIFIILILLNLGLGSWFFIFENNDFFKKVSKAELFIKYADDMVQRCAGETYRPACYDREVPKLMDVLSMREVFDVVKIIQTKDKGYPYCHVLAHKLSAAELRKDPMGWKDLITKCPSGVCSNGCLHGGLQERFRAETYTEAQIEEALPDLYDICEPRKTWNPTQLEQGSCYHALGHLTMYLTSAEIKRAIPICEKIGTKSDGRDYRQLCYDGAFMQLFQPLEEEDFELILGKEVPKEKVASFCGQFSDMQKGSCWNESWPVFFHELQKPQGLTKHCSNVPAGYQQDRCYYSVLYALTPQLEFNVEKITQYCLGLPAEKMGVCFASTASRLVENDYRDIDDAVNLCKSVAQYDTNSACFEELVRSSSYHLHVNSPEFKFLCSSLPEPWRAQCSAKGQR